MAKLAERKKQLFGCRPLFSFFGLWSLRPRLKRGKGTAASIAGHVDRVQPFLRYRTVLDAVFGKHDGYEVRAPEADVWHAGIVAVVIEEGVERRILVRRAFDEIERGAAGIVLDHQHVNVICRH